MELPTVRTQLRDPNTRVVYRICAYRDLTREEAVAAYRAFVSTQKRKPKRGSVIDVLTTIVAHD